MADYRLSEHPDRGSGLSGVTFQPTAQAGGKILWRASCNCCSEKGFPIRKSTFANRLVSAPMDSAYAVIRMMGWPGHCSLTVRAKSRPSILGSDKSVTTRSYLP